MSRFRRKDNSSVVSLFPFLAVLLCTMGALLVVLVLVASLERKEARARAAAEMAQLADAEPPSENHELQEVDEYLNKLDQLRAEAQQRLRDEQSRLSHVEDHLRRLQEQLARLLLSAEELDALGEEHVDDREQAEREVERLEQLIADKRNELDRLREESDSKRRSYAIVPYVGPNGTYRRPIMFELRRDVIILQPEGIRIVPEDLQPPVGPGNALAAAVRAAREYHLRQNPSSGASIDDGPYAYFVVRPSGTRALMEARRAVEAAGLDFGFELVEGDWNLKYPTADPRLAGLVEQAVEQARMRQRMLAEAAPRMHRNPVLAARGRFDAGNDDGDGHSGGLGDGPSGPSRRSSFGFGGESQQLGGGVHGMSSRPAVDGVPGGAGVTSHASGGTDAPGGSHSAEESYGGLAEMGNAAGDDRGVTDAADTDGRASVASPAAAGGSDKASPPGGPAGGKSGSEVSTFGPSADQPSAAVSIDAGDERPTLQPSRPIDQPHDDRPLPRGEEWSFRQPAGAVPIRRTIHIVVRGDHIAILESKPDGGAVPIGNAVQLRGPTRASMDELVTALRSHIDDWGPAGSGFYWRPVLELNVGPDGQQRAEDLGRLLKNSGLVLRTATAPSESGGPARATR